MCLNTCIGTSKTIIILFGTNRKLMIIDVPILKHFTAHSSGKMSPMVNTTSQSGNHTHLNSEVLSMEFALSYGIWELLRCEKVPETHIQATLLTGNAWLFNGKISCKSGIRVISEFCDFWRCALHKFTSIPYLP